MPGQVKVGSDAGRRRLMREWSVPELALVLSLLLVAIVLWDGFETVVLPRTVSRRLQLARVYFRATWRLWARAAALFNADHRRERFLAVYGPISLVGLVGVWALGLVIGFGGLQWAAGSHLRPLTAHARLLDDLYMSGTTFFTLGLGDLQPVGRVARFLTVAEAGTGFGFLALVIAYFPVLYQSFSRREAQLTILDAWAGSPPAAAEVLRRLAVRGEVSAVVPFLKDWERWCSDLLESHISYPAVAFFRSQHTRQSWVSALAAILDLSALVEVGIDGVPSLAGARHVRDREAHGGRSGAGAARRAAPRRRSAVSRRARRAAASARGRGAETGAVAGGGRPAARAPPLVRAVHRRPRAAP